MYKGLLQIAKGEHSVKTHNLQRGFNTGADPALLYQNKTLMCNSSQRNKIISKKVLMIHYMC
jgi:hypothetical protein